MELDDGVSKQRERLESLAEVLNQLIVEEKVGMRAILKLQKLCEN
jgi:hypothetical protein